MIKYVKYINKQQKEGILILQFNITPSESWKNNFNSVIIKYFPELVTLGYMKCKFDCDKLNIYMTEKNIQDPWSQRLFYQESISDYEVESNTGDVLKILTLIICKTEEAYKKRIVRSNKINNSLQQNK